MLIEHCRNYRQIVLFLLHNCHTLYDGPVYITKQLQEWLRKRAKIEVITFGKML